MVLCQDDLTYGMLMLSTLKVKLHAYTSTHTQRGVKPVTLSEIKNTESVYLVFQDRTVQNRRLGRGHSDSDS